MAEASVLRSKLLAEHGITGFFTLRHGGVSTTAFDSFNFGRGLGDADSNINSNMSRLMKMTALPALPHQAKQVHGTQGLICHGSGVLHESEADMLLSTQASTSLAVRTADCLPILLADPVANIAAAVHAGWRGTAACIVKHAVERMTALGAEKRNLLASLGPCIGPCCFEIGEETATALNNSVAGADRFIIASSGLHADLSEINRLQLIDSGLTDTQIESRKACTSCENGRFFSYRRDNGCTGRHLAVVATLPST